MVKREFVSSGSGGRDEIERPQAVPDRRALRSRYFNVKSIIHGIYLSILYFLFLNYVFDIWFRGLFATMYSFEFWKFVILCLVAEKVNRIVWFFCPRIELFVVILCLVAEKRDFFVETECHITKWCYQSTLVIGVVSVCWNYTLCP